MSVFSIIVLALPIAALAY